MLYAFDLLELDGDDLQNLPIETRKATLASLLRKSVTLQLSERISADGPQVFAHACKQGIINASSMRPSAADTPIGGADRAWLTLGTEMQLPARRSAAKHCRQG